MAEAQKPFDLRLLSAYTEGKLTDAMLPKGIEARQEALLAIAEVEYRLNGTSKCSICRAPVRAAMRSVGIDAHDRKFSYKCLCRRCLEGEKAYCVKLTSYVADLVFDEFVNRKQPMERSKQPGTFASAVA